MPILLHGGGIDSTACLILLVKAGIRFSVVHFDYGQASLRGEEAAIRAQCRAYGLPFYQLKAPRAEMARDGALEVKGRNAMLISAAHTIADDVYVGFTSECLYPDSSIAFIEAYQAMLRVHNPRGRLLTPVFDLHKGQELMLIRLFTDEVAKGFVSDFIWTCNVGATRQCFETLPDEASWCPHCQDLKAWLPYVDKADWWLYATTKSPEEVAAATASHPAPPAKGGT